MFEYTDGTKGDIKSAKNFAEHYDCMLLRFLRRKQYTANDTPLTSRVINSWTSLGLLDDVRTEPGQGWRKFSIMDIIFIVVLTELRKFGISIDNLKNTKQSLFMPCVQLENQNAMTWLEFAYIRAKQSINDGNTYILVDNTGQAGIITERDMVLNRALEKIPDSYIYMNFNKILVNAINDKHTKLWSEDTMWLYRSEMEFIDKIRTSDFTEYKIKVNDDRKITWIEQNFSGKPKEMEQLHTLISKIGYGELNLTIKNGSLCHLRGTKQEKTSIVKK